MTLNGNLIEIDTIKFSKNPLNVRFKMKFVDTQPTADFQKQ